MKVGLRTRWGQPDHGIWDGELRFFSVVNVYVEAAKNRVSWDAHRGALVTLPCVSFVGDLDD